MSVLDSIGKTCCRQCGNELPFTVYYDAQSNHLNIDVDSCKSCNQDSHDEGYSAGKDDGKEIGFDQGTEEGYNQGYDDGLSDGYSKGFQEGFEKADKDGFATDKDIKLNLAR